jgi:S1/P1 Nuclease
MSAWRTPTAIILASLVLFSSPSRAWGPEGHAMIAEIAEIRLANSPALDQINQILGADDSHAKHLDQIASWADAVRPARPETQNWHFVDIPLDASDYQAGRDCKQTENGDCVIAALQRSVAVLRDKNADSKARVEALKFIVHFVGDIHQPLHTVNDCSKFPPPECDRGGNKVKIRFRDHRNDNFHSVWDGGMIEDELQLTLGDHFQPNLTATAADAKKLEQKISDTDAKAWAPQDLLGHLDATLVKWANDSHSLAQTAYRNLPIHQSNGWEDMYEEQEWTVVEEQLQKAGVRLAEVLKEALQ